MSLCQKFDLLSTIRNKIYQGLASTFQSKRSVWKYKIEGQFFLPYTNNLCKVVMSYRVMQQQQFWFDLCATILLIEGSLHLIQMTTYVIIMWFLCSYNLGVIFPWKMGKSIEKEMIQIIKSCKRHQSEEYKAYHNILGCFPQT